MEMWMIVAGIVISDLAIAGVLWRGRSAARGWCRDCDAPDLWTAWRSTPTAKVHGTAASLLAVLGLALALVAPPPRVLLPSSVILFLAALMFAIQSRIHRRRLLCCRTCGTQYDPRRTPPR